jgi:hypothetical protein
MAGWLKTSNLPLAYFDTPSERPLAPHAPPPAPPPVEKFSGAFVLNNLS